MREFGPLDPAREIAKLPARSSPLIEIQRAKSYLPSTVRIIHELFLREVMRQLRRRVAGAGGRPF
jgi:hypothetical protein